MCGNVYFSKKNAGERTSRKVMCVERRSRAELQGLPTQVGYLILLTRGQNTLFYKAMNKDMCIAKHSPKIMKTGRAFTTGSTQILSFFQISPNQDYFYRFIFIKFLRHTFKHTKPCE